MSISAKDVKVLRDRTGAGMMDCKEALQQSDGDMEAAVDFLRSRGEAKAAKRAERSANEGVIGSYIHHGGRIGVLVEVNCETDFVANTDELQTLARDLAMHVAAAQPLGVTEDDLPSEDVERERQVYLDQVRAEGKPEHIQEKIVDGKLRKYYEENVLMKQAFVKDPDRTVEEVVTEATAKTGEKVTVSRFVRFEVGETAGSAEEQDD